MGYNGNNRGRTHNWSGVGNKRHYNWGLNLTAKTMVAPFAILSALAKVDTTSNSTILEEPMETFSSKNSSPIELIRTIENKNDELHQTYYKTLFIKQDIRNIKRNIILLGLNVFRWKRNRRTKRALNYIIERRKRLIKPIALSDYNVGTSINSNSILGRVTIHDVSQQSYGEFSLGCLCKNNDQEFHKDIEHLPTLAISTRSWQMLFFEKAVFVEDKKGFAIIPYENINISHSFVYNSKLTRTYGYKVNQANWYHSRIDGGPDRRYKDNFQFYTILRHQATISINGCSKSIYLLFETPKDYNAIAKIIESHNKTHLQQISEGKKK